MKKLRFGIISFLIVILICGVTGCASEGSKGSSSEEIRSVVIGTMPTEDMLAGWVAVSEGYFEEEGVDVSIEVFDSAPALSAAITSGQVDMAMTDVMRTAKLCESGVDVVAEWITLGQIAEEGRFGILAPADAPYDDLAGLARFVASSQMQTDSSDASGQDGVGVAANTVPEYVLDRLLSQSGIDPAAIPTVEIASLPDRYGLVAAGNILAAALPNSMLTLGEANGLKVIGDDTTGDNISMSIMIARESFAQDHEDAINLIAKAWDKAVAQINESPFEYLSYLVEYANLNSNAVDAYSVSHYPFALQDGAIVHPDYDDVAAQIEWMQEKGYLTRSITYDASTGMFKRE